MMYLKYHHYNYLFIGIITHINSLFIFFFFYFIYLLDYVSFFLLPIISYHISFITVNYITYNIIMIIITMVIITMVIITMVIITMVINMIILFFSLFFLNFSLFFLNFNFIRIFKTCSLINLIKEINLLSINYDFFVVYNKLKYCNYY